MANSLDSYDSSAAESQRSLVETTVEAPSYLLQSSEVSGVFPPGHANDSSGNNRGQGVFVTGQEDTRHGVNVQESDAYDAVLSNEPKITVPEIVEETSAKKQEEEQVRCSEKCAHEIQVIEDTALVETSLLGNGKLNTDGDGSKRYWKRQETEEKKEKKSKRRGGKARKNKAILNFYSIENKEKKGQQYSRKEMEALRFEGLDEQKMRWVEVYCGLSPLVAQEYDGLVKLDKTHQEDSLPSFDFDPRCQFKKSADLGEECSQFAGDHFDNLNTSDPSSFLHIRDEIGCSVVEEECSEGDDSDEDYSSIQRPAFLVSGEPDFDSGPPQDGLEYLRRGNSRKNIKPQVLAKSNEIQKLTDIKLLRRIPPSQLWEAARVPKVTIAKVNKIKEQSVYMPQVPDITKCPENLLPLKQWEDSFLADFSELRLSKEQNLRSIVDKITRDKSAFTKLDLEGSSSKSSIKQQSVDVEDILNQMLESNTFEKFVSLTSTDDCCPSESTVDSPENPSFLIDHPTLSKILKMNSAARTSMLKRRISSVENMSTMSHDDSLWLFALCAAVDCPLDADTSAALRSLLRKCASLRAAKTEVDDEVVILNILVTISGRYFGQLES
ncbi:hypothetical protein DH2020_020164 [Rehmannia glutinosa]|uniref:Uncharacterized protein n=1 Tax=Rehmannia glutinosa TaxID=99300 RepID=A0ABR0WK51_REHGL